MDVSVPSILFCRGGSLPRPLTCSTIWLQMLEVSPVRSILICLKTPEKLEEVSPFNFLHNATIVFLRLSEIGLDVWDEVKQIVFEGDVNRPYHFRIGFELQSRSPAKSVVNFSVVYPTCMSNGRLFRFLKVLIIAMSNASNGSAKSSTLYLSWPWSYPTLCSITCAFRSPPSKTYSWGVSRFRDRQAFPEICSSFR